MRILSEMPKCTVPKTGTAVQVWDRCRSTHLYAHRWNRMGDTDSIVCSVTDKAITVLLDRHWTRSACQNILKPGDHNMTGVLNCDKLLCWNWHPQQRDGDTTQVMESAGNGVYYIWSLTSVCLATFSGCCQLI